MKFNSIFVSLILTAIVSLVACQKSQEYQDVLFFTGTEESSTTIMYIDGPSSMGLSVTSSCKVPNDVQVTLAMAPEELSAYNLKHGTSYQLLPAGSCGLSNPKVTIPAGKHVSGATTFELTSLDDFNEGVIYCMPVRISDNSAGLGLLNSSRVSFIVINQILVTQCVNLRNTNYFNMPAMIGDASLKGIGACTMECRVLANSFPSESANPGIQSVIGVEENFLLRLGDISCEKNQAQLCGGGASITTNTRFNTAQWYHIAVVDTGSTLTIYVNGVADTSADSSSREEIDFSTDYCGGFHIGFSVDRGRCLNGYVSEARVWTRALTPAELNAQQCYVDPKSDGLLGYWRMDSVDENGNVKDLTGHGYDAKPAYAPNWVEGIKCPIVK